MDELSPLKCSPLMRPLLRSILFRGSFVVARKTIWATQVNGLCCVWKVVLKSNDFR